MNSFTTRLDPLIVTSPIQRCGTTLLQRLLCSAPNALIYGEKVAQDLEFFLSVHSMKAQEYAYRRQGSDEKMARVLQGQVNDWIMDLSPDPGGYLAALQEAAFAGTTYCRDFAIAQGRPIWGFKYPAWSVPVLKMMRRFMPEARLLFISRDLICALKSAKGQHMIGTEQQLQEMCRGWLDGMAYIRELGTDPRVMSVRYEQLAERPEETLAAISAFSGARGMDVSVLQHKINVWPGQEFATQSSDGYIPPVDLSERERRVVEQVMAYAAVAQTVEIGPNGLEER